VPEQLAMSRFTGPLTITEHDVDNEIWSLAEELVWEVGAEGSGIEIRVPVGFLSDGASIPWPLSIVLNRWGRWRRAACLHDHCHARIRIGYPHPHTPTRKDADRQFYDAMLASGVWRVTALVFRAAVRLFGGFCLRPRKA
jgi:hypothetical protein